MNIEDILVMMDEILDKSVAVPFSGKKSLIDVDAMGELIHQIRLNLPREVEQARGVVNERKNLINDANREADKIIKVAEERARQMITAQEISRQAQSRAEELMATARRRSNELSSTTGDYLENMLNKSEKLFTDYLAEVQKARISLKQMGSK